MQTETIVLDREEARSLYRKYREHQHYSTPIDHEVQRTYQLISQGRVVIRALASIVAAGLDADERPKLAIIRADAERCYLELDWQGGAMFAVKPPWQVRGQETRTHISLPADSFPRPLVRKNTRAEAMVPLVPVHLRPKRGLANYHILFEAEWRNVVPVDPMLLRRIGKADLWVVCAAWDLTPVEQAVLAGRLSA